MQLTHERLRAALHYDPLTGVFTWKLRTANRVKVGDVAGRISNGYRGIRLDGTLYLAHRLAWFWMTGAWPQWEIDHKDTDRCNNIWTNLRDVTHAENTQNIRFARSNNTAGVLGAHRDGNKFSPRVSINGKRACIGSFSTAEEASAAYVNAKRATHPGNTL